MKKNIITIAGRLGSGKSTANRLVAEKLGFETKSTGDFMRAIANERGVSLEQLSKLAETDPSIDAQLDRNNTDAGSQQNIILDSRLGFHFIPDSYKVFLELDPKIAAERILRKKDANPNRATESHEAYDSVESIVASTERRLASERKRFKELYGIEDHTAHSNFDLVINTGEPVYDGHPEAIADAIVNGYQNWLKGE